MIFFSDGNDEDGGWENFTIIDITTTKAQPIRFVREVSGKTDKSMLMLGNSTPYNCNYQFPTKISLLPGEKFEMNVVNNSLVREMEFYVYILSFGESGDVTLKRISVMGLHQIFIRVGLKTMKCKY